MSDTTKRRGTQRTKKVTTKAETAKKTAKTKDQVAKVNVDTVAESYLKRMQSDLVPIEEFAKSAGVTRKELANALEDKGAEFFAFDMMQKQPCDKNHKGEIFAHLV